MAEEKPKVTGWMVALVLMPALLIVGTVVAVAWKVRTESRERPDPRLALAAGTVDREELRDHYQKLSELVGKRDWESADGRRNVRRAIAMIGGTLSPQNYGFEVRRGGERSLGGELWPTLWAEVPGREPARGTVLVAVPYDRGDLAVGAVLSIANDLRDDELSRPVRMVFYPASLHEKEPGMGFLVADGEALRQVLCVNRFSGGGDALWLADRDGELGWPATIEEGTIRKAASAPGGASAGAGGEARSGRTAPIAGELRVFASLGAPVAVCRGVPRSGEGAARADPGDDRTGADEDRFLDRYLARTVLLRDLIRSLAEVPAKRP